MTGAFPDVEQQYAHDVEAMERALSRPPTEYAAFGQPPDAPQIEPIAHVDDTRVGDMLDAPPAPRRWLLDKLLPLGVVGALAAGGGTGKSMLTIQLSVAVAAGRPFLGIPVGEPGGVLIVAAEDEREEMHRRLWRIVDHMQRDGDLCDADMDLIRERLHILSRVGDDNRLTAEYDRVLIRTHRDEAIAALAAQLPNVRLIVLDPVSRFRGGDENSNEAATRFVESVEALRNATGATVLLPHHVSKASLAAGAESLSMEGLRGASALVDGVRWAAAMATMRKDAADEYDIDPDDHGLYVRLDAVKNNYAAPWPGMWLERLPGGVLVPTELERSTSKRQQHKNDDRYREVLAKLQGFIRQRQERGNPISPYKLRDFAGQEGIFGVGDKTLRAILERAIEEGHIAEREKTDGNGRELHTWA